MRRLNRIPILIGVCGCCLVVGAIGYSYDVRSKQSAQAAADEAHRKAAPASATILNNAPAGGEVQRVVFRPMQPPTAPKSAAEPQPPATPASLPPDPGQGQGEDEAAKARKQAWQTYYQQLAELQRSRLEAAQQAMQASTAVGGGGSSSAADAASAPAASASATVPPGSGPSPGMAVAGAVHGLYGPGFAGYPILPPATIDAAGQREKRAFLAQAGATGEGDYLAATIRDPISPYELKAGSVIPAVLVSGIDSDVRGFVIGRVAENVYDTATGRYLLIPQGATLTGTCDNSVSPGQTRVVVVWNRIICPDASSIDIGAMPGADQGGYQGFHDLVNTHLWSKLGNALLISIAGAGVQLSQGTSVSPNGYNSQQIAAAALGQQFGELGQEYARAGLTIPNTLEIRPGYRWVVMVTKDMVLRPWVDRRNAATQPVSFGPVVQ